MKYNDNNYRLGRKISSSIINLTLNPKILDKEYILESGHVIFCGNHLHVWDQFPVMCSTKVTIHWMAKKEYFDGKMGPVFKFMGCIPVDRKGNPHIAKEIAIEYLNSGSNIGLFPEGTRNGLKEDKIKELYASLSTSSLFEYSYEEFLKIMNASNARLSHILFIESLYSSGRIDEKEKIIGILNAQSEMNSLLERKIITQEEYDDALLLPFKFGAVSMAKSTNSKIIPFAVTGDYKIGNDNLMVSFDEPLTVAGMDLEDANGILRNKIIKLVKSNYERGTK